MKIDKKSWHYRLVTIDGEYPPSNLCAYMRKMFTLLLVTFFSLAVILSLVGSMVALPWVYDIENPNLFTLLGILGWVIAFGTVLSFSGSWLIKKLQNREPSNVTKPPSLVGSYIKAKHDKICPILEFDD